MKALFLRLRRQQLPVGIIGSVLAPTLVALLFPDWFVDPGTSQWGLALARGLLLGLLVLGLSVATALRYPRSSRVLPMSETDLPALSAQYPEGYCLLLRTFGRDGHVLLPRANRTGRIREVSPWTRSFATAEEAVATAATETLGVGTIGIVDQRVRLAPPGPTFRSVSDEQWRPVAAELIRGARVTVLLLGPEQRDGRGFHWEIDRLRALGPEARVVIALPPPDRYHPEIHHNALDRAAAILRLLRGTIPYDYASVLTPLTLTVAYGPRGGTDSWAVVAHRELARISTGRSVPASTRARTSDWLYRAALAEAFTAVRQQD